MSQELEEKFEKLKIRAQTTGDFSDEDLDIFDKNDINFQKIFHADLERLESNSITKNDNNIEVEQNSQLITGSCGMRRAKHA